jgi:hypothetical protein
LEHDEPVTADSGDGVGRSEGVFQPLGHQQKQLVADGMTDTIIDRLEAFEVEGKDGEHIAFACGQIHSLAKPVIQ